VSSIFFDSPRSRRVAPPGRPAIWEPGNLATCPARFPGFQFSGLPPASLSAPNVPGVRYASGGLERPSLADTGKLPSAARSGPSKTCD